MTHILHLVLVLCVGGYQSPDSARGGTGDLRGDPSGGEPARITFVQPPVDSTLASAQQALARGLPWRASRLVAPVLRDSSRRTPAAVMLAATAASAWRGWPEVQRLLEKEAWTDSLFEARGRALLARAAFELEHDSLAVVYAAAAVANAGGSADAAERVVLLARALDRAGQRDSARAAYDRGAAALPLVADWLRLRAAGVTTDSAARATYYEHVGGPVAPAHTDGTEAAAREHTGDLAGAILAYAAIGDLPSALRLRVASATSDAERAAVRQELMALIAARRGTLAARRATDILTEQFSSLTPGEALLVARSAAETGPLPSAAAGYRRALAAGAGTPQDRFDYGSVLARLGRHSEAAFQFNLVREPKSLAAAAAYQRARSLVRDGQLSEGESALREIGRRWASETEPAASALFLLADLATDERRDADARATLLELTRRYPESRPAPGARLRAAIIAFANGHLAAAAAEMDTLAERWPERGEAIAALYWSGRARAAAGDTARAIERWRTIVARDPLSYYAGASERRLGIAPWAPPPAADSFAIVPALDSGMARAALLDRLGLEAEARWEYERLARDADGSLDRLLATADAFRRQGLSSQSIRLAWRAAAAGAPRDARLYRLLYPVAHSDALLAEAWAQKLDPSFVAALIRQESMFNSAATSSAGARGLMQIMPELGGTLARGLEYPVWDPVLLYQFDVSLELGTVHLRELLQRYDRPVDVLAAYNAGASRVQRWLGRTGSDDAELFAERIPYTETRDYVRVIQRSRAIYRTLYSWDVAGPTQSGAALAGTGAAP